MDWNKGFTYKLYGRIVDPSSWADKEQFNIPEGTISKTDSEIRESANITVLDFNPVGEQWIRVYMDISQNDDSYHVPLFTGIATSPSFDVDGIVSRTKMECYSALKPLEDIVLPRGWYARAYRETDRILKELFESTPAPVEYAEDLPTLERHLVSEDNESCLSMLDKMVEALDLTVRISGDGRIRIARTDYEPQATFTPTDFDIIEPQLTIKNDWYECPNVVMAIDDELMAIARDDNEDSSLSVQNRGREIWYVEDGVDLGEDESLAEYARRTLQKKQMAVETLSYKRRFVPDLQIGDCVRIRYPQFAGIYRIMTQRFDMDGSVSEEVARLYEQNR